jgi:hypothetical protein
MVVVPAPKVLARPLLFTVATEVFEETQAARVLTSMLVPSDCVAVAVNCWVAPIGRLGFGGVISTREVTPEEKGNPSSIGPHDIRYNAKADRINPLTIRPLATTWIFSTTTFTPA